LFTVTEKFLFHRWVFNPAVLTKVTSDASTSSEEPSSSAQQFAVGDVVTISADVERVKELQKGHGKWTDSMLLVCGCIKVPSLSF
jgi:Mind bomb SH3 repeat domain